MVDHLYNRCRWCEHYAAIDRYSGRCVVVRMTVGNANTCPRFRGRKGTCHAKRLCELYK